MYCRSLLLEYVNNRFWLRFTGLILLGVISANICELQRKAYKIPHNKLLYINNVPTTINRADLKREFARYGDIEDVQMFSTPYVYPSCIIVSFTVQLSVSLEDPLIFCVCFVVHFCLTFVPDVMNSL